MVSFVSAYFRALSLPWDTCMKRSISSFALLLTSVSAILGSGWLFATLYTSQLAGPSAMLAWIIGGLLNIVIAYVFAELSAMLPITGSSTRIPLFTHGRSASFMFAWAIWLSYMAMVPTEVQAVLQYVSYYAPGLVHANGGLTAEGYWAATGLMIALSALNVFSLRWLLRANSFLTIIKVVVPVVVVLAMVMELHGSHDAHVSLTEHFMPYGWRGVFQAIVTGGILFAFNGFKQACEMAGEAKRPSRALPIAIVGSVVVCLVVYALLQLVFLRSLTPHNLATGWQHLVLATRNSPFVSVVNQDHLHALVPLLYIGAIVGPLAAGLMYVSSSSRSVFAMSENQQLPSVFLKLTTQGNPSYAIILNFVLGMLMFAPLPGWDKMVTFLTSLMLVTYALGPVCMMALRRQVPDFPRPFRLPFGMVWSYLAFAICTALTYFTGWTIIYKLCIAMVIGLLVFVGHQYALKRSGHEVKDPNWRASIWVWPFFAGLGVLSYLGGFGGGLGVIPFGWDMVILAVFCLAIFALAIKYRLPSDETQAYIDACGLPNRMEATEGA